MGTVAEWQLQMLPDPRGFIVSAIISVSRRIKREGIQRNQDITSQEPGSREWSEPGLTEPRF